ncbi:MAG: hypothetical protein U9O87_06005 [Verrucomicrobiota bacterium]|nr:hypothetical protein [Verrucomicrobiota bacterium]
MVVLDEGSTPKPKELVEVPGCKGKVKLKLVQVTYANEITAPVQRAEVTYQEKLVKGEGTFWKSLNWFESPMDCEDSTFETIFALWLVLYLLIYIPVLFITKFILKVP